MEEGGPSEIPSMEGMQPKPCVRYRTGPGGAKMYFSPARRVRPPCGCWRKYSYPDDVVIYVINERKRLELEQRVADLAIEELKEALRVSVERVNALEHQLAEERASHERTRAELEGRETHHRGRMARVAWRLRSTRRTIHDALGDVRDEGNVGGGPPGLGVAGLERFRADPHEEIESDPSEDPSESLGEEIGSVSVDGPSP